ncbi:MAG: hypothetical protein HOP23_07725 [Methylococcaceae bacterium]|nr:hypothetical protein [Methylococcaceae bacterium]
MKNVTFWEGVFITLLTSVIGSISFFALTLSLSEDFVIRLLISGLAIAYMLYLIRRSQECTGWITLMLTWFILLAMLWMFYPPLTLFLVLHVLAIWLVRSLYSYASLFSSLADLVLNAFSIASAVWALHHTGSIFLTFWCFFLLQALFVFIPTDRKRQNPDLTSNSETDFNRAYQAAEAAVRKLSTFN